MNKFMKNNRIRGKAERMFIKHNRFRGEGRVHVYELQQIQGGMPSTWL